jgi:ribosomal protein S18 acetylase RimI-like enzyme
MNVNIRPACGEDLDAIVGVHLRAFEGFPLTTLGPRFISELYQGFLTIGDGRLLVAEVNGKIVGVVAGTFAPDRFFRRLMAARWFRFGLAAIGAVTRRPRVVLPRLVAAIRYRGDPPSGLTAAGLLSSIAVDPQFSGLGIGTMLITAYCDEALKQGLRFVYLTTDRDGNESTNFFYRRHGFKVESQLRRPNGRVLIRYVRTLDCRSIRSSSCCDSLSEPTT